MPFANESPSPVPSFRVVKNGLKIFDKQSRNSLPGIPNSNHRGFAILPQRPLDLSLLLDGLIAVDY